MANHQSAEKRIRQTAKRTIVNKSRLNRVRSFVKKVEMAIVHKDKKLAEESFLLAQPEIHRGVKAGVLHRNTAGRKLSRLISRIKSL
ncbi:MAG: 30S ribosomal protein S20 [Alphaproteobacteria bacterium]|nr:30S ribosomal protein S20 [Alphaproteobacteria bacterium]